MQRIEKKQLKRMNCPKCDRPKLRFEHSADGIEPDGGTGPEKLLRCDVCKIQYKEGDAAIQKELQEVLAHTTPAPVFARR
jgi:ribosomal protein L37AE/L43A